jgi:hypothetical protein
MSSYHFSKKLTSIFMLIALVGLACGSRSGLNEISPPSGTIPISQEAANRLKDNLKKSHL